MFFPHLELMPWLRLFASTQIEPPLKYTEYITFANSPLLPSSVSCKQPALQHVSGEAAPPQSNAIRQDFAIDVFHAGTMQLSQQTRFKTACIRHAFNVIVKLLQTYIFVNYEMVDTNKYQ